MLKNLMNCPIIWLILNAISIISFIFGVYSYLTSKNNKRISYSIVSDTSCDSRKKDVQLLQGVNSIKKIKQVHVAKFVLWNSGNDVIETSDVVETKELSIVGVEDIEFLRVNIVTQSDSTNKFTVKLKDNKIHINFDYINHNQGAVLEIFYTGNSRDMNLAYVLKGGQNSKKVIVVTVGILKQIIKKDLEKDIPAFVFIFLLLLERNIDYNTRILVGALIIVIIVKYGITGIFGLKRLKCPRSLRKHCELNIEMKNKNNHGNNANGK